MKKSLLAFALSLSLLGCGAVKTVTVPATLAPGYSSSDDQVLGQSLAAVTGFRDQEVKNYATLSPALQAKEKGYLNTLIDAVNVANTAYLAYHSGLQTLAQAQSAFTAAQNAQTSFTTNAGVK